MMFERAHQIVLKAQISVEEKQILEATSKHCLANAARNAGEGEHVQHKDAKIVLSVPLSVSNESIFVLVILSLSCVC